MKKFLFIKSCLILIFLGCFTAVNAQERQLAEDIVWQKGISYRVVTDLDGERKVVFSIPQTAIIP